MGIEQLLDREPIQINKDKVKELLDGSVILVTGATGSIGSELVRQICKFHPLEIVLFDRNENAQFFLEKELNQEFPQLQITTKLGSITDVDRLRAVFQETHPSIVFHCAANKHVPLSESNPSETIVNNIQGTKNLAEIAFEYRVEKFILISTDKAVNPTSIMGTTKRICELLVQIYGKGFITVRFGNVLGSNGSVIPIFQRQIQEGKSITITHPDMLRYFMTIPEATQLLLQAATIGKGGEIFILDMGEPIKITDLAKKLMKLEGKEVPIEYIGIRPGEKIIEELSASFEITKNTEHPRIKNTQTSPFNFETYKEIFSLLRLPYNTSKEILKKKLNKIIPEYKI